MQKHVQKWRIIINYILYSAKKRVYHIVNCEIDNIESAQWESALNGGNTLYKRGVCKSGEKNNLSGRRWDFDGGGQQ
mgnify:CR=1 FL=1